MDRRSAMLMATAALLGACGGGGGGGGGDGTGTVGLTAAPAPSPGVTSGTPASLSPNIVTWGDSLTTPTSANLQMLYPNRVVANFGFVGWTSTQIANAALADNDRRTWISTFWYGHNNDMDPATIKADIAASVAHLAPGNTRFIVIGLVNKADGSENRGTPRYETLLRLNAELAAAYAGNYIDMRSFLISQYNPSIPQDVIDFNNDVPPSSLRFDEIHLRNEGSLAAAQRIKQFIDAKGW